MKVERKEGESFNKMFHRFKKLVEKERVISDYKKSKLTKRERKKLKQFAAERRRIKMQKKLEQKLKGGEK